MDDDDNVVDFRAASTPSARLKEFDWSDKRARCPHKSILVWAKEPILECGSCGAVVDPYQWIRDRVSDWRSMVEAVEFKKRMAQEELDSLKKQLRLLRREYKDEAEKRRAEGQVAILPPQRRV